MDAHVRLLWYRTVGVNIMLNKSLLENWLLRSKAGTGFQRCASVQDDNFITLVCCEIETWLLNDRGSKCARKQENDKETLEYNWSNDKKICKWLRTYQANKVNKFVFDHVHARWNLGQWSKVLVTDELQIIAEFGGGLMNNVLSIIVFPGYLSVVRLWFRRYLCRRRYEHWVN